MMGRDARERVPSSLDDHRARQSTFNASSQGQWDGFAGHRRAVSNLLGAGEVRGGEATRLCVLGAGNTNDLDLPGLLEAHREVHLVDLDGEALGMGATRQGVYEHPGLRLHGGLDVSSMLDAFSGWSPRAEVGPADLAAMAGWPSGRVALALPGPFDRVASTCLLSQLVETACHVLGDRHPRIGEAVSAIRAGHLRLLARLTRPGGSATLITDVVSTRSYPALSNVPEQDYPDLLPRLARSRQHILGLHPGELMAAIRGDSALAGTLSGLEPIRPWGWRLHDRVYLVWAVRMKVGPGRW
ncbi:hypothetical protein [Tautonia plasticadhaerens]|uniref:Uncharacterized protein n=1 Tax=Tautonia plasticadhaerens TaxID=2527974 RepID=A0A518H5C6_9BACT|nr:hypothetical protein [Tautonia plasticadhaerens]QDV36041.1 hypothetical protein ElP_39510 [Tautonia plasticadhaerens]